MAVFYRADVVRKVKGGFKVFSEKTGRPLSRAYRSKGAAKKRLQQIEYFKHRSDARKLPRPVQKSKPRLPRQIPPTRHAEDYTKALVGLVDRLRAAWRPVIVALPGIIEGAQIARADAFNPDQPRDEGGRWAGGATAPTPRTTKAAAAHVAAEVHARKSNDPGYPGRAKVESNWAKKLNVAGIPASEHEAVDKGIKANNANPKFAALKTQYGPEHVVLTKPPEGERRPRAERVGATLVYHNPDFPLKDHPEETPRPESAATHEHGGTAAMLRHEYGHTVYDQIHKDPEKTDRWRALRQTIDPRHISSYAATKDDELFSETLAIVTSPKFDPNAWTPAENRYFSDYSNLVGLSHRKDIDDTQRLKALIAQAAAAADRAITQHEVEALARKFADRTQLYHRDQLSRQVRAALGVDPIFRDKGLAARTDQFTHENVALVKRIPQRLHGELESMVTRAVAGGVRGAPTGPELTAAAKKKARTLAGQIEDRFDVSEKHARVIARNQIGKFYAGVNHARQKEMGVTRFVWRTVGDERVRGTPGGKYPNAEPSHYDLDGEEYSYDDPPQPEGANEPILPGEDYQCRCWAEPIFEDFNDEGDDEDGGDESDESDDESDDDSEP